MRVPVWREAGAVIVRPRVGYTAFFLTANDYAGVITTQTGKFFDQAKVRNDVLGLAALKTITQIVDGEQGGSGDNNGPQLDRGEA